MRIEAIISVIFAFCCVISIFFSRYAAAVANNLTFNYSRRPRFNHIGKRFTHWKMALKDSTLKKLSYSELQQLLKLEENIESHTSECCPSVVEMVEPVGGRNVQNMYVELYRNGDNAQRFYETSCRPDVLGKPCKYIDHRLKAQSRCVQLYSYSYAIVKNNKRPSNTSSNTTSPYHHKGQSESQQQQQQQIDSENTTASSTNSSPWALDYIELRSGCGCKIFSKRLLKLRLKLGEDPTIWQSHIKLNFTTNEEV